MRAVITLGTLGTLALASPAAAAPSHTCTPTTIGDAVLDKISSDFNAGFDNQDPDARVRGFQLHIDKDNNALPDGTFIKWPDPWPVSGADSRNRTALDPADFVVAGSKEFGIMASINDINATNVEVGFSCHPDEFDHALKDGAIRSEVKLAAAGKDDELQLQFRWHIKIDIAGVIKVDEWFVVDLVDVDLPNDKELTAIAALVPEVTPDGLSVKLNPFVNLDDVTNELTFGQLADEFLLLEATLTPLVATIVCLPTGLGSVCTAVVTPIVAIGVGIAVDELRKVGIDKLKQALTGYIKCLLEPFNRAPVPAGSPAPPTCNLWAPPPPGENRFIRDLGDRLRGQLAKLDLPNKILALKIPNYNEVVTVEPDFVHLLCP